jgi:hypothetical protein
LAPPELTPACALTVLRNRISADMAEPLRAGPGWMLERGMGYIDAALAQAPDDPHILDSKGWGLFRLGRGEQALAYFERAIAAFGAGGEGDPGARSVVLVH